MIKIIYFAVIGYKEILSYYTIMAKTKLRTIYNDFGLRLDVREARKLLGLPKTAPKAEVHHFVEVIPSANDIFIQTVKNN